MKEYIFARPNEVTLKEAMHDANFRGELIRCKDCKWYYGDYCGGFGDGAFTSEDGFCHNAERKEE